VSAMPFGHRRTAATVIMHFPNPLCFGGEDQTIYR